MRKMIRFMERPSFNRLVGRGNGRQANFADEPREGTPALNASRRFLREQVIANRGSPVHQEPGPRQELIE